MEDKRPKISFIVPVYKVEKYLPGCIESIIGQTYSDFEVILIDDGSPDRCGEICDEYAAKDARIKVIHQNNGGLSRARNRGMDEAQGEYLWFVDSDDYITEGCLSNIVHQLEGQDLDMLILSYLLDFEEVGNKELVKNRGGADIITGEDYVKGDYYEAFAWLKVTRASVFKAHNLRFHEGLQYEDIQLMPFLMRHVERLAFSNLEDGAYCYRIRPGSITTTTDVDKQKRQIGMCFEIEETWREAFDLDNPPKGSYDHTVKSRLLKLLHSLLISMVIRSGMSLSEKNAVYKELIRRGILLKDIKGTLQLFNNEPTKQLVLYRILAFSPRLFNAYSWIRDEIGGKLLRSRN
ncbi:MAG: glycosyltransferase [Porphyromonas sp.]|nr:glycosyltransferase [Bacteroidales bacterium]MDD7558997.1 glycosyltransferase [Bacteroidales bacterium]MDY3100735.1 glycosyltransferase [Porphyromonas sp.]